MQIKRRNLLWFAALGGVALTIGLAAVYLLARPIQVSVAAIQTDVPIQVFGLGTVEAQTLSRICFETAGTLVELKADHGDR
jgi:HlyD family secretion protein